MAQFGTSLRRPSPETQDDAMPRSIDADNIVTFPASTARDGGATALDLIYQAAEIFTGIENRARDIEANARAMCQNAVDKLLDAERRVQTAEQARRDIIADVDRRLQDVALALADAQARIDAADARATAADKRAAAAEAEAQTARRLLTQVEDAIRSRLLGEDIDAHVVRRASA